MFGIWIQVQMFLREVLYWVSISLDLKTFYLELNLIMQMPSIAVDHKCHKTKDNTLFIFIVVIISMTMSLTRCVRLIFKCLLRTQKYDYCIKRFWFYYYYVIFFKKNLFLFLSQRTNLHWEFKKEEETLWQNCAWCSPRLLTWAPGCGDVIHFEYKFYLPLSYSLSLIGTMWLY